MEHYEVRIGFCSAMAAEWFAELIEGMGYTTHLVKTERDIEEA